MAHYFFKAELPGSFDTRKARRLDSGQRWDMACYRIEQGLGFHNKMKQQKATMNHSHVVAYHYQEWLDSGKRHSQCSPLEDSYLIQAGDKLILLRVALPPNQLPPVPDLIRQQEAEEKHQLLLQEDSSRWSTLTEEERLSDLINFDGHQRSFSQQKSRLPPPHYICHNCGKPGHFKSDCPNAGDPTYVAPINRKRTTGLPLSQLRKALPEEYAIAWLHKDGTLVMPKF